MNFSTFQLSLFNFSTFALSTLVWDFVTWRARDSTHVCVQSKPYTQNQNPIHLKTLILNPYSSKNPNPQTLDPKPETRNPIDLKAHFWETLNPKP